MFSKLAGLVSCVVRAFLVLGLLQTPQVLAAAQKADAEGTTVPVLNQTLPAGARIYVAPMNNAFENHVIAGLLKQQVPEVVMTSREEADFELTGVSARDQPGWASTLFLKQQDTNETASVKISLKSGEVVFAHSVMIVDALGKQRAGESVARQIKLVLAGPRAAQQVGPNALKAGATVFIAPIEDGFDDYLKAAIQKKQVPITVVADKAQAEFEISGHSETHRATISKMLLLGRTLDPNEQASIRMANLESGEVVFIRFGFSTSLNGNELVLDRRYNGGGQREHAAATGPARS